MTGSALAGKLTLLPGLGLPAIVSSRVPLANRLLRGRPARHAPAMLGSLYALCGQAHRLTAQLAIDAASGLRGVATPEEHAALAAETMREHVRRIWLDWPRLFGADDSGAGYAAVLRACPLFQDGAPKSSFCDWIEQALLGEAPADWLAAWRADPAACMARWTRRGKTMPARLLHGIADVAAELDALERLERQTPRAAALLPHAQDGALLELAAALDAGDGFENQPVWQGRCAETGSWNRLAGGGVLGAPGSWLRLGARVAELAALASASDADAPLLSAGALALGPGEALAWSEMARGLLLHRVRLESGQASGQAAGQAEASVGDYKIVAPTEWNFHPRGAVASILAQLPATAENAARMALQKRRISVLAAAFDPCVSYEIEFEYA